MLFKLDKHLCNVLQTGQRKKIINIISKESYILLFRVLYVSFGLIAAILKQQFQIGPSDETPPPSATV